MRYANKIIIPAQTKSARQAAKGIAKLSGSSSFLKAKIASKKIKVPTNTNPITFAKTVTINTKGICHNVPNEFQLIAVPIKPRSIVITIPAAPTPKKLAQIFGSFADFISGLMKPAEKSVMKTFEVIAT